jgi:hypothetical protein
LLPVAEIVRFLAFNQKRHSHTIEQQKEPSPYPMTIHRSGPQSMRPRRGTPPSTQLDHACRGNSHGHLPGKLQRRLHL